MRYLLIIVFAGSLVCACGPTEEHPDGDRVNNVNNANNVNNVNNANNINHVNHANNANNETNQTNTDTTNTNQTNNTNNTNNTNQTNNTNVSGDTSVPTAIDTGSDPNTPGTYKGLPLAITDNGSPTVTSTNGKIGVVCIGMSNSSQECGHYIDQINGGWDQEINPAVVVVNCAVGGNAIERWNDPALDDRLWDACINQKIGQAGLTLDQVKVVYHKAANQFTAPMDDPTNPYPPYPDATSDYFNFIDNLETFSARVVQKLPSLQAVYTSSRIHAGFSTKPGRGEPLSYEEGHALNTWLSTNSNIGGVWFGWGPYLWGPDCASGLTNGSGVCYVRADFQADGVHPAMGARQKVAEMIHNHLLQTSWYKR